jgi:hypothetical protein
MKILYLLISSKTRFFRTVSTDEYADRRRWKKRPNDRKVSVRDVRHSFSEYHTGIQNCPLARIGRAKDGFVRARGGDCIRASISFCSIPRLQSVALAQSRPSLIPTVTALTLFFCSGENIDQNEFRRTRWSERLKHARPALFISRMVSSGFSRRFHSKFQEMRNIVTHGAF